MEKLSSIEEFEVDDNEADVKEAEAHKTHKNYSFIKLVFILFLILLISLLFYVFTGMRKNEKKKELKKRQDQKILLEEGTQKLIAVLATVENTFDQLDDQIEQKEKTNEEKKSELKNYKEFININNSLIIEEITEERDKQQKLYTTHQEINEAHMKEAKILRGEFLSQLKVQSEEEKLKNEIGTTIFDTDSEISLVKSWIDKNDFNKIGLKLCFRGSNSLFNPRTAYNKCNFYNKLKEFLIVYQTECFGRFGIFYGASRHKDMSFVFEMEQKMRYIVPKQLIKIDANRMNFPGFYFSDNDSNKEIYPYTIKITSGLKNVEENDDMEYDYSAFGSFKIVEKNMPKWTDISEIEMFYLE